jgi:glycosyltransferase involved in cell wall biosynthesis
MEQAQGPTPQVSVIIPVYKGADTMPLVLEALYKSTFRDFEAVVVNDCSPDNTLEVLDRLAPKYPHHLVDFSENLGVSKARNAGVRAARGEIIIFIDADCLVEPETLERCVAALGGDCTCVGGAYTKIPWDKDFFSTFQSLYIHHVETKVEVPDYVATHCMAIRKSVFEEFGGFVEDYFIGHAASVEDVEFSHRLVEAGHTLCSPNDILVKHMFRFNLKKSVTNAIKKSKYWTMYSLQNRDVMQDSGAASYELKINVFTQTLNLALVLAAAATGTWWLLLAAAVLYAINVAVSYKLLRLIKRERGWWFLTRSIAYYQLVYPYIVAYGSSAGVLKYVWEVKIRRRYA